MNRKLAPPIALAAAALMAAACSSSATATGTSPAASASFASDAAAASASAAAASPSAPFSQPPAAPTRVEFVVSGTAPDGIDITYGPAGSNLAGPSVLDGTATESVPFDGSAEFYALSAQLQGDGDITCKIVVTGPGDNPLTASSGAASGSYNICSAQAEPVNGGLSWNNEN